MAKILFFGRFSDLSGPLNIELPNGVTDKPSLTAHISKLLPGFAELAALPDTRISVNMMVSMKEVCRRCPADDPHLEHGYRA